MPKFKIEFDLGLMCDEVDRNGLGNTIVDMLGLHLDVIDNVMDEDALEGPHDIYFHDSEGVRVKVGTWGVHDNGN